MKICSALYLTFFVLVLAFLSGAQQNARKFELQGQSPKFWDLVGRDAKLDRIATGFGFTEGPVWDPAASYM